jgi:hypothetical protein
MYKTPDGAALTLINGNQKRTLRFDCKPCEIKKVEKLDVRC